MQFPDKESIKSQFEQYSDDQLIDILRNQQAYQKLAVEAAKEIALCRGLMQNQSDLPTTKPSNKKRKSHSIFPSLNTPEQEERMIQSLLRIFYLATLFPLIFAFLSYAAGNKTNLLTFGGVAILWILFVYQAGKTKQAVYIYALLFLLVTGPVLLFLMNQAPFPPRPIDLLIWILSFLLMLYLLLYAKSLISRRSN